MKTAICLSGQSRTWKRCWQNWNEHVVSSVGQVDWFVHFWDYNNLPQQIAAGMSRNGELPSVQLTDGEKDDIIQTIKPKSIVFEPRITRSKEFYEVANPVAFWTIDQFDSMRKAAHLKRRYEIANEFNYDLVIRLRSDLFFMQKMQFAVPPPPNTVHVDSCTWDDTFQAYRVSDIFFFADSTAYDQAASFYDHMPHIDAADVAPESSTLVWPPEVAFYYYYKSVGLCTTPAKSHIKVMRTPEYVALKGRLDAYEVI